MPLYHILFGLNVCLLFLLFLSSKSRERKIRRSNNNVVCNTHPELNECVQSALNRKIKLDDFFKLVKCRTLMIKYTPITSFFFRLYGVSVIISKEIEKTSIFPEILCERRSSSLSISFVWLFSGLV